MLRRKWKEERYVNCSDKEGKVNERGRLSDISLYKKEKKQEDRGETVEAM